MSYMSIDTLIYARKFAFRPADQDIPCVFVETGTYQAEHALMAAKLFREVHSIERNPKLWEHAMLYRFDLGVTYHLGDSRIVLPILCRKIKEPAVFFLDAHWGPHPDMDYGDQALPLWSELDAIMARPVEGDVVIIDDVSCFGKDKPTPHWLEVTIERIMAVMLHKMRIMEVMDDQLLVFL